MSTEEQLTVTAFTAHSNLSTVCLKYKLSRADIESCIKSGTIQITDAIIPINEKQGTGNQWMEVKANVKDILKHKLNEKKNVSQLLAGDALLEAISDEISRQLERRHNNQGLFGRLFNRSVSEDFHYAEKFGTTDIKNASAEYILITGNGRLECDKHTLRNNEVRLSIELHIRAVTVRCQDIKWENKLDFDASKFMMELEWRNVKVLPIQ